MRSHRMARAAKFIVFGALVAALVSAAVMGLWTWLMPTIFGWRAVTFWHALGLLALSRILFGRLGGPGRRMHWRGRMMARWQQMTPEEREKFLAGIQGRCGPFAAPAPGPAS